MPNNNINISLSDIVKLVSSFKDGSITLNFDNFQLVANVKLNQLQTPAMKEFVEEAEKPYNKIETKDWEPLDDSYDDYEEYESDYDTVYEDQIDVKPERAEIKKASKKRSKKSKKSDFPMLENEGWGFSTVARNRKLHFVTKDKDGHQIALCKPENTGLSFYDGTGTDYCTCEKCKKALEKKAGVKKARKSSKKTEPDYITMNDLESHTVMIDNPIPEDYYEITKDVYIEAAKRAIIIYAKNIITQIKRLGGINRVHVDQTTVYFYTDSKIVKTLVVRSDTTNDAKLDIKHVEVLERTSPNSFINGFAIKIDNLVEKVIEERKNNN